MKPQFLQEGAAALNSVNLSRTAQLVSRVAEDRALVLDTVLLTGYATRLPTDKHPFDQCKQLSF